MMKPRFVLDEDNDIIDEEKIKIYDSSLSDDWERLCILLNTLNLQLINQIKINEQMHSTLKRLFDEYNNYIDEYSMLKIDIIMDIAEELGISLE